MLIDKGYLGLNRLGIKYLMPFKASKKKPLTLLQKQINREISKRRIRNQVFKLLEFFRSI